MISSLRYFLVTITPPSHGTCDDVLERINAVEDKLRQIVEDHEGDFLALQRPTNLAADAVQTWIWVLSSGYLSEIIHTTLLTEFDEESANSLFVVQLPDDGKWFFSGFPMPETETLSKWRNERHAQAQRARAYHEAGHLVVGHRHRFSSPLSVTIRPDYDSDGHVLGLSLNESDEALITLLAGREAHFRHDPDAGCAADQGAEDDLDRVSNILSRRGLTTEEKRHITRELRERAAADVEENWTLIARLAGLLHERETLGASDIENFFDQASGQGDSGD